MKLAVWYVLYDGSYPPPTPRARPSPQVAETLLEHGADINAVDALGRTALTYACVMGAHHMVTLLISKGARIEVINKETRSTPLIGTLPTDPPIRCVVCL